jgi:hypothetical protein
LPFEYAGLISGASVFLRENSFAPCAPLREIPRVPVSETIRKKLSAVPHKPGVYLHKDRFGTVIYVGKALNLRKRVKAHQGIQAAFQHHAAR